MDSQSRNLGEKETGRLEAFSDGVYSIAMTLLVLDLKVPPVDAQGSAQGLLHALGTQWPSYLAFVVSFFTILIMWVNHHAMFKLIARVSRPLLFANGFLLMMTVVVPFTTGLVSEYLRKPGATLAMAIYCGAFVLISAGYNLTWQSAARERRLIRADVSDRAVQAITRNYFFGIPSYSAAMACAFISPGLSIAICAALCVFWSITAGSSR